MAEQMLKLYGKVYITEDTIHNKIFMKEMKLRGIEKVSSVDEIPYGAAYMCSAHGIAPSVLNTAEKNELTIVDGTCPIVKSIQKSVQKAAEQGKKIIIIGNRAHQEIISLLGYANNKGVYVVYNEVDINLLPSFDNEKVAYFTQTTLDTLTVEAVINALRARIPHIESDTRDNICSATKERQNAVKKIAKSIDLFIIIGSLYSSNSRRLEEVAIESGAKRVIRIDSSDEIDTTIFSEGISTIAITSGASAPEFLVEEVVEFLRNQIQDIRIENC